MSNCVRYSCGSISCLRQVEVRLARMAAVRPPRGLPTNKEFLRLSTTRFISRSDTLLSMGTAAGWTELPRAEDLSIRATMTLTTFDAMPPPAKSLDPNQFAHVSGFNPGRDCRKRISGQLVRRHLNTSVATKKKPPVMTDCEVKVRGRWLPCTLWEALTERDQLMRCKYCHGPVQALKEFSNGARA